MEWADLFIVGQFGGVSSTTAVSIGSQIMHMLTVMIVGLAMGSTVMIGRSIGAKNKRQAAECIRKYGDDVYGNIYGSDGSPSCACPTNCWDYVYSSGGSRRDSSLSDYLFYRDSFYHSL